MYSKVFKSNFFKYINYENGILKIMISLSRDCFSEVREFRMAMFNCNSSIRFAKGCENIEKT